MSRTNVVGMLGIVAALLLPRLVHAQAQTPQQQVAALQGHVDVARAAAQAGDIARARAEYTAFRDGWQRIEDGVRAASPGSYGAIEQAMQTVQAAFTQQPVDETKLTAALTTLDQANEAFIAGGPAASVPTGEQLQTLAAALGELAAAQTAATGGDVASARAGVDRVRAAWPGIEGAIAAKDGAAYARAEALLTDATTELATGDARAATATLVQLTQLLEPFVDAAQSYGVLDAASIVLREGLEAILIIAALLAFLRKSGNADKRGWVWAGGVLGIVASLLTAVAIQQLSSALLGGANRELMEGITGLVAAVMLLSVSYWMHTKTHVQGWQHYIQNRTNAALATGSLLSLAALAFLAVFREGAETTLFYLGMAPSIALRDLVLGLGLGVALLVLLGVAVLGLGKRLPLKPFFLVASLLIWYLGFKFIGLSIRKLQIAEAVPETHVAWVPSWEVLGLYPTWQTVLPQLLLLVGAILVVLWTRRSATRAPAAGTS